MVRKQPLPLSLSPPTSVNLPNNDVAIPSKDATMVTSVNSNSLGEKHEDLTKSSLDAGAAETLITENPSFSPDTLNPTLIESDDSKV